MIRIKNLKKTFDKSKYILDNINFNMPTIGLVAVTGDSGSGKSTFLDCISGSASFDGSVMVDGMDVKSKEFLINKKSIISRVYQDYRLLENFTIEENLRLACEIVGEILTQESLAQLMRTVGLDVKMAKKKCKKLSGGEKQRAAIAVALSQKTKIILADEPTANLDSKNAAMIFDLFKSLSSKLLVVVVTHSKKLAEKYSDFYINIENGKFKDVDSEFLIASQNDIQSSMLGTERDVIETRDNLAEKNTELRSAKQKLSKKLSFLLIALPYKNKIILITLSIFLTIFTVIACFFGGMTTMNQTVLVTKNARESSESIVKLSNNGTMLSDEFIMQAGLSNAYYSFENSTFIENNIPRTEDNHLDASYIKYNDSYQPQNFIECDNVDDIGGKLLQGRNIVAFDEIIISEVVAYYLLSVGSFNNKKITSYNDIIGCTIGDFTIVGLLDAQFDRCGNRYLQVTRGDYLNMSENEKVTMENVKYMLDESNIQNTHIVSVGYSERMRNKYNSINNQTLRYNAKIEIGNRFASLKYEHKNYVNYVNHIGVVTNEQLHDNEIVLPKKYADALAPNGSFTEPYTFSVKFEYSIDVIVIGYTEEEKIYVSSTVEQEHINKTARIFNAVNFSSKMNISKSVKRFSEGLISSNLINNEKDNNLIIQSSFTNGIDSVVMFLDSFRAVFIIIFIGASIIALLFGATLVYLLIKRVKTELKILHSMGYEYNILSKYSQFSMLIIWGWVVALLTVGYCALCGILNAIMTNVAFTVFTMFFFDIIIFVALSAALLATMSLSTVQARKIYK